MFVRTLSRATRVPVAAGAACDRPVRSQGGRRGSMDGPRQG
ncbi:hypothetical protein C4K25_2935 [Pseudomonas chlororaphis]|nr:hypothetical protein C4K25_2935 [Pseudomonas chlororaphis]